jgi:hypothetical protein
MSEDPKWTRGAWQALTLAMFFKQWAQLDRMRFTERGDPWDRDPPSPPPQVPPPRPASRIRR